MKRLEVATNVALLVGALVFSGSIVRRELRGAEAKGAKAGRTREFLPEWQALLTDSVSHHRGDRKGVEVVEFVDLECPYCARHNAIVDSLLGSDSIGVSYRFVHLPLRMHRFALPAARAAECAGEQGRFFEFISAVMRQRDSLGLKSWGRLASDAGVRDTATLVACASGRGSFPRIDRGVAFAESIGIQSTPTVLVNGYRLSPAPTDKQFAALLDSIRTAAAK